MIIMTRMLIFSSRNESGAVLVVDTGQGDLFILQARPSSKSLFL